MIIQVDERAVLKHFDWPEQKADALREAAFGYCDVKKLESEASSFRDDPRQPYAPALKKIQSLFEKYCLFFPFLESQLGFFSREYIRYCVNCIVFDKLKYVYGFWQVGAWGLQYLKDERDCNT